MATKTSAGILIRTKEGKYLQCHATGKFGPKWSYDIPKGEIEKDETTLNAALRELYEETGVDWRDNEEKISRLQDHGEMKYLPGKNLYLFSITIEENEIPLSSLKCLSHFTDSHGKEMPEIDGYRYSDDIDVFYKNLGRIIRELKL